jgi:hypothetical protein
MRAQGRDDIGFAHSCHFYRRSKSIASVAYRSGGDAIEGNGSRHPCATPYIAMRGIVILTIKSRRDITFRRQK